MRSQRKSRKQEGTRFRMDYVMTNGDGEGVVIVENAQTDTILGFHANSHCDKLIIDTNPGIEPASLAWKARGFS
uniref:Uncharacterized protein n=1 Tax=Quercus lobata TaxID=97700 RepID=A0A7N2QYK6_QUELO